MFALIHICVCNRVNNGMTVCVWGLKGGGCCSILKYALTSTCNNNLFWNLGTSKFDKSANFKQI